MIIETTTTDDLLNELTEIRNSLKSLQETERDLKRTKNDLESRIIANLERQGIDRVGNGSCTVSIKKETVPTVEDWDTVQKYIRETGRFELLHKRMSAAAFREILQMGQGVPGVKQTELTRINFRSK